MVVPCPKSKRREGPQALYRMSRSESRDPSVARAGARVRCGYGSSRERRSRRCPKTTSRRETSRGACGGHAANADDQRPSIVPCIGGNDADQTHRRRDGGCLHRDAHRRGRIAIDHLQRARHALGDPEARETPGRVPPRPRGNQALGLCDRIQAQGSGSLRDGDRSAPRRATPRTCGRGCVHHRDERNVPQRTGDPGACRRGPQELEGSVARHEDKGARSRGADSLVCSALGETCLRLFAVQAVDERAS